MVPIPEEFTHRKNRPRKKSSHKVLLALMVEVFMGWSEGIGEVSSTWSGQEKSL